MHHKCREIIDIVCKTTNGNIRDQLPTKSPIEFEDNSIVMKPWKANLPGAWR